MKPGILYALGAYLLWGLFPIYWKRLGDVPALEILANRMVWSLVFMLMVLAALRHWRWLATVLRDGKTLLTFTVTSALMVVNWLTYIWAVNAGFVVETSLGYFINPLVSVLLGVFFLGERLREWQWVAVAMAALGVTYLTISYGSLPWIALTLAFSFGLYGLLKKTARLNSIEGLTLEMIILFPIFLLYLLYLEQHGIGTLGHANIQTNLLLVLAGVVTAVPLLLFAAGARRIPLSTIGILQFVAPTIQFILGVYVYQEPFTVARLTGFSLIWLALLLYTAEGVITRRRLALARASVRPLAS